MAPITSDILSVSTKTLDNKKSVIIIFNFSITLEQGSIDSNARPDLLNSAKQLYSTNKLGFSYMCHLALYPAGTLWLNLASISPI